VIDILLRSLIAFLLGIGAIALAWRAPRLWPALRWAIASGVIALALYVALEPALRFPIDVVGTFTWGLVWVVILGAVVAFPVEVCAREFGRGRRVLAALAAILAASTWLTLIYVVFVHMPVSRALDLCLPPANLLTGEGARPFCTFDSRQWVALPIAAALALLYLVAFGPTLRRAVSFVTRTGRRSVMRRS